MRHAAVLALLLLAAPVQAQDRAGVEGLFRAWVEEIVWPAAQNQGVSRATFDAALSGVIFDWALPDLVPPGSTVPPPQRQAEFSSPDAYFRGAAADAAVGREMAARHADTLARVEAATGVPGRILLAIWGRESAFGRAEIPQDAFRVLATKGFASTRPDVFTAELLAALEVAERGLAPASAMRSSWAGALGQPQFMPSSVLAHATDGDGDGRADIWGSEADTLASIGAYLAAYGWVPGRDWGFEVTVPEGVSCALEGPDQGRSVEEWEALGVARVGGRAFPETERDQEAFLVLPAGQHGPAFLATPNFYVLKDYNESDLYALYVGHVADRIAFGAGDFTRGWDPVEGLTRADVAAIQRGLQALGHDTGGADGLAGFRTRRAIGLWQEATRQAPTCFPERGMAAALGAG